MKLISYTKKHITGLALVAVIFTSCRKDGNPNNLPDVSPAAYEGKIDGYTSSEEVYPNNLRAYWSFDDTKNELKSGTAPAKSANDTYATDAVRGKSLQLAAGYLHFTNQFNPFKTDSMKNWSISLFVKLKNNGSKRTMVFQLARPGMFNGNINFALNTNGYPETNDSVLRIQPTFLTVGGGTQDNLNNVIDKANLNNWVHIVLTYDFATGVFNNWMNGVKVGNFPNRGTGNSSYKAYEPSEVLFGANYNAAGMPVSTDVSFAAMTGKIDEVRIFNITLPDAHIKALYNLGVAKK
jgi:hypothetical protein